MKKEVTVLSLFDGKSCGRIALERAGISVKKYYSSEIDKFAIQVSENNYPDIERFGDVTKWREWNINWSEIDLIIAGSPCQGFSFAGKQLNFDDPRSALFFEFLDICFHLSEHNPKMKFLLENVKMKKECQDVISEKLGVQPIEINSNLVSAQNRKRLYWTNIPNITQPEDKGILLKDVLENEVEDKFYLSEKAKDYMSRLRNGKPRWEFHTNPLNGKSACLTANMFKGVPYGVIKEKMRKLTPIECERLQTVPDNYTDCVSNSQRYKMLGNGWTIDVIAHIFKNLYL